MSTITERVAAGAAFLDEREPGWDQRISLDELSIGSSCNCILGQLHGNYTGGLMDLNFLYEDWSDIEFGFMWSSNRAVLGGVDGEVAALTAEWKRVITERRSAS